MQIANIKMFILSGYFGAADQIVTTKCVISKQKTIV